MSVAIDDWPEKFVMFPSFPHFWIPGFVISLDYREMKLKEVALGLSYASHVFSSFTRTKQVMRLKSF